MEAFFILIAIVVLFYALIRLRDTRSEVEQLRKRLNDVENYLRTQHRSATERTTTTTSPTETPEVVAPPEKKPRFVSAASLQQPTPPTPPDTPVPDSSLPPTPPLPQPENEEWAEEFIMQEGTSHHMSAIGDEFAFSHEPIAPQPQLIPKTKTPKPSRTKAEWESFVGGKLLNRIGALALIIGMGFFLKYAFDNNWINETARCLMGGAAGIAILLFAEYTRKKDFVIFAQGLAGAGIVILYLSIYAAFNFYHLLPQIPAFLLMIVVTSTGFLLAWRFSSIPVALLTWAGGFLTPFLLSTGTANEIGLFTYIAVLNVGILAMLLPKKEWRILELPTLVATIAVYLLWKEEYYARPDLPITVFFLAAFWAIFFLYDVWRMWQRESHTISHQMMAILNPFFTYLALTNLMKSEGDATMALTSLLFALPYLLLALAVYRRGQELLQDLVRIALGAVIPVAIAAWQYYNGDYRTVFLWSLEALLLAFITKRSALNVAAFSALALFAGAIILLYKQETILYYPPADYTFLWNKRVLAEAGLIISLLLSAHYLQPLERFLRFRVQSVLHYSWMLVLLTLLGTETLDFFTALQAPEVTVGDYYVFLKHIKYAVHALVLCSYSIVLLIASLRPNFIQGIRFAILLIIGSALWLLFAATISTQPHGFYPFILNARVGILLAGIAIVAGHFVLRNKYDVYAKEFQRLPFADAVYPLLCYLLFFGLITRENAEFFARFLDALEPHSIVPYGITQGILYHRNLVLTVLWTLYSAGLFLAATLRQSQRETFSITRAFALALLIPICVLLLSHAAFKPIEDFHLLFNSRALGYIVATAVALWYSWRLHAEYKHKPLTLWRSNALALIAIVLFFVLLNSEAYDFFRRKLVLLSNELYTEASSAENSHLKNMQQLTLSGIWLCYSVFLMVLGLWKHSRALRILAIVLFFASIIKVFGFDLSFLTTLYRIFSFMGLGVILLAISFLYQKYKHIILEGDKNDSSTNSSAQEQADSLTDVL